MAPSSPSTTAGHQQQQARRAIKWRKRRPRTRRGHHSFVRMGSGSSSDPTGRPPPPGKTTALGSFSSRRVAMPLHSWLLPLVSAPSRMAPAPPVSSRCLAGHGSRVQGLSGKTAATPGARHSVGTRRRRPGRPTRRLPQDPTGATEGDDRRGPVGGRHPRELTGSRAAQPDHRSPLLLILLVGGGWGIARER